MSLSSPRTARLFVGRLRYAIAVGIAVCSLCGTGCTSSSLRWHEFSAAEALSSDAEHYDSVAAKLEFSAVSVESDETEIQLASLEIDTEPRLLLAIVEDDVWRMTLAEAIHQALSQNAIILTDNQFLSPGSTLLTNPEGVASVFDPELQQTSVQGQRGSTAAAADFIPFLSTQMISGRDENIQNNLFSGGLAPGEVLDEKTGQFSIQLGKQLRSGGEVAVRHDVNFDDSNVPSRLFGTAYANQLSFDINQPLLSGAGYEFTDVAGPPGFISQRSPSLDQGVHVARINEQLSRLQFENSLRQLVKDVTDVYWDLSFAHRQYEIELQTQQETERVWNRATAKLQAGLGEGAADEAQAAESFYAAQARTKGALAQIVLTENRLRRLLNLPGNDHQIIRPLDVPTDEPLSTPWFGILTTAFANRPELEQTKFGIHSLELQVQAAQNFAKPRLDLVGNFRINGFGDKLFSDSSQSTTVRDSAYDNLGKGDQTGWTAGLVFSTPIERRTQKTLLRNLELRLTKTRSALAAQEWEITRELTHAYRSAERWQQLARSNAERVTAAQRQVRALDAAFPSGKVSIDLLVRAQSTRAQAETELARSLVEYEKALAELQFRQGTLLRDHRIAVDERD